MRVSKVRSSGSHSPYCELDAVYIFYSLRESYSCFTNSSILLATCNVVHLCVYCIWLTQSLIPLIYSDAYSLIGEMKILNIWGIRGSLWACLWSKCSLCQYQLHMNCFMNKLALGRWSQKQHFSSKLICVVSSIVHIVYTPYFGRSCSKSPI